MRAKFPVLGRLSPIVVLSGEVDVSAPRDVSPCAYFLSSATSMFVRRHDHVFSSAFRSRLAFSLRFKSSLPYDTTPHHPTHPPHNHNHRHLASGHRLLATIPLSIAYLFRRIINMPGLDLFGSSTPSTANTVVEVVPSAESTSAPVPIQVDEPEKATETAVSVPRGLAGGPAPYYNARLDPKNFLEGPLSLNPATRLRQMLARPGIVVRILSLGIPPAILPILIVCRAGNLGGSRHLRWYQCALRARGRL